METQETAIKERAKGKEDISQDLKQELKELKAVQVGDKCLVPKCQETKATDDTFFCLSHRDYWRRFCIKNMLTIKTPENIVRHGLSHYTKNI